MGYRSGNKANPVSEDKGIRGLWERDCSSCSKLLSMLVKQPFPLTDVIISSAFLSTVCTIISLC